MKKILGLDLGIASIGWAVVNEAETNNEKSSIIQLGVRVNPLTTDEKSNFEKGKSITTNADRTLKRGMRRNLQRYKLRRKFLIDTLKEAGWISEETILAESGNFSTFQTLRLRAKAVKEELSLEELSRVLLMINKKRGYKSNRKVKGNDEGQSIDSIDIAKYLYDNHLTPGEYVYGLLIKNKYDIPDFYRSDLEEEFDKIWNFQKRFYPDILTDDLKESIKGKNERQTWEQCEKTFNIAGIKRDTKGKDLIKENYEWRSRAIKERIDLEKLATVFQKINGQLKNSSGYLGNISDRSKSLYFEKLTIGQYLVKIIESDPNRSLKNIVFYRQDYLDEFNRIWEVQAAFHTELTSELKHIIRDIIIFYQRPLKSQKGLVSICELEYKDVKINVNGKDKIKRIGPKVCPKSSPLFQEFKIWQAVNNIKVNGEPLDNDARIKLAEELSIKEKLSKTDVLKLLFRNYKGLDINLKNDIDGNRTQAALYKAYAQILENHGYDEKDELLKKPSSEIKKTVYDIFKDLGYNTDILDFNTSSMDSSIDDQPLFRLWHILYSYEGDKSKSGNQSLIEKISEYFGFDSESAKIIADISFVPDYGNLSTKAIRKILPFMKDGKEYSAACEYAGYRHSRRSLNKEELENKDYIDRLDLLPKNSLRNPVVEKILNQMINVVNGIIDKYGKPDEIRIELARDLKKNRQEREKLSSDIAAVTRDNEKICEILKESPYNIINPSRKDIIRYKLYQELKDNGYKTIYSNTYIPKERLFSDEFDIEHIIPQAKLFDDSFSNKTIETKSINIEKRDSTAYDFVKNKYGETGLNEYKARVENLFKKNIIGKTKYLHLLMSESEIPEGFIERDLRNSQYIAKKAVEILEQIVRFVVPTSGKITARLREDWQLVDIMQELSWDKYDKIGLTTCTVQRDGRYKKEITGWTKRDDHRHHAMDALTIAFTKRSYIQYLNNLNARIPKENNDEYVDLNNYSSIDIPQNDLGKVIRYIESTQLYRVKGKLKFLPPVPLDEFRSEAKKHLQNILVSVKAKNKVVTNNNNRTKVKGGYKVKLQLTPRGKLHNETIYGSIQQYVTKEEKINASFNAEKIDTVANASYRNALKTRLQEFGNDPHKAFTGKNSLDKKPVFIDDMHTRQVPVKINTVTQETVFTIRKAVSPENFKERKSLDKIIDNKIRNIMAERLAEYGDDAKRAFTNLDSNPIWLNREKGICIKKVTVDAGLNKADAIHIKRDNQGNIIYDDFGQAIPADFVMTGNNHHIAIFQDMDGNLQEHVVSFFEAVTAAEHGDPIVNREYNKGLGWKFLFTLKQNEYFVFPNEETGFNPKDIDLMNPDNYSIISPNLYRVQKMTTKDYFFRHHLETSVDNKRELQELTWKRITSINKLKNVVKVRINHIGQIVQTGEY